MAGAYDPWGSIPLEGTPMLKPGLAEAVGLAQPADLARVALLPDERWAEWLVTAGVDPRSVRFGPVEYPTQELAAAAAEAGAGVALLSPSLFRSAVVEGRLLRPFSGVVVGPGAYHILTPAKPLAPEVEHFVGWLVDQLGRRRSANPTSTLGCSAGPARFDKPTAAHPLVVVTSGAAGSAADTACGSERRKAATSVGPTNAMSRGSRELAARE